MSFDLEDHPDLKDAAWIRAANRRAHRDVRRQRRRARMRAHSGKIVSAISLVVIGAVLFGMYRFGAFDEVALPDVQLPTVTAPYKTVNTETPFVGTPAEKWADGEKGIVVPDQNPEYAASYEATRKALVTAHLDPKVIVGHDVEPFAAMLAPPAREAWRSEPNSSGLTRLKKGTTLLPNGIKVDGRMWPGRDQYGRPIVHTSYRFAYAFDPGEQKALDQYEIVALVRADTDYQLTEDGLWTINGSGFVYSMACEASKEGFLAPSFTEKRALPTGKPETRRPEEWFAPDAPIPTTGC